MKIRKDAPQRVREMVERLAPYIVCTRQRSSKGMTIQNNFSNWSILYRDVPMGATEIAMLFDIVAEATLPPHVEISRRPDGLCFVSVHLDKTRDEKEEYMNERIRRNHANS